MSDQAYLNTRISAMATGLLDRAALERLLRMPLAQLAEHLGLDSLLDEQLPRPARSRAVEQALIHRLMTDLAVLLRPMREAEHELALTWGRKYALLNLKTLIRGKLHQLEPEAIRENLYDLPENVRLPHQALFRAENVLELLRILERGPYRQIARQGREVYEDRREPFALESAIDRRYFTELVRQSRALSGADAEALRGLLGALLDHVDLLWLLRFRFSYGLSPSEAFYELTPSPGLLHRDTLLHLANLESLDQVLEQLPGPLATALAGSQNLIDAQHRSGRHLFSQVRHCLARSRSGIARALAYLMLRECNLFALFSITQGQLLGLSDGQIERALELDETGSALGGLAHLA